MNETDISSVKRQSIFSYADNLPVFVRVVAFLLFLVGALGVAFYIVGATDGKAVNPTALMELVQSILFLVISTGLARLKKWGLYLWTLTIIVAIAFSWENGLTVALLIHPILLIITWLFYKKFS